MEFLESLTLILSFSIKKLELLYLLSMQKALLEVLLVSKDNFLKQESLLL